MRYDWQERLRPLGPIPLRVMLGFGFLLHGYPKLFTAGGAESLAGMLAGMGIPAPGLSAHIVGAFEFFGGILLILGVTVRAVSALGVVEMAVAALLVHAPAGFSFMNVTGVTGAGAMQFGMPGYEVNLLYMAGFISLMLTGPGPRFVPKVGAPRPAEQEERPAETEATHAAR